MEGEYTMSTIQSFIVGPEETNCYLVYDEQKNCVLIDCNGTGEQFINFIEANELQLKAILLTHGHADHIAAVPVIKEKFQCPVYAGIDEKEMLEDSDLNLTRWFGHPIFFSPEYTLKEGDEITFGTMKFQVWHTPGHTKGSVCYQMGEALFAGDTLFAGSCGRTDLATGSWEEMKQSLQRLKELPHSCVIYPGHGPSSTMALELEHNPYLV